MSFLKPRAAVILAATLSAAPALALYTPPSNPWITDPSETRVAVDVTSGSLTDAQARIDAARSANPGAVLVISMSGTYTVTGSPLRLPSLSSLALAGTIRAGSGASASALISISGQDRVAVAGGTLDGAGANLTGISVVDSLRINIDKVTIVNTGREAIWLDGTGTSVVDAGASIVRCDISGSGLNAIVVRDRMQAIVVDNNVHDNAATGIHVTGAHNIVTNNTIQRNATGILIDGTDNAVSKNTVSANGTGIRLGSASTNNSVFQNTVTSNTASGIALAGTNNMLYSNALSGNAPNFTNGGSANYVVPDTMSLVASGNNYFHPPTINNRHTNTTIVNGRGRFDVNVGGTNLTNVQTQYNNARSAHPNDVIVLNLTGTFTHSTSGLTLQSYSAVVLNGTINVSGGSGASIKGAASSSYISVSGGTINGNGRPAPGIQLPTVMAVVDRVTVNNFGQKTPRTSGGSIHLSGNGGYAILRGNRVDVSGGRCIWTQHSAKRYLALDNHTSNCNMDGIDFDSHTSNSIARGNRCEDSIRYGLFIEEGAARNKAWDNDLNRNEMGVNIFSYASGPTERNTVFMNRIGGNARGVRNGAGATLQTRHNFIFNNVVTGSTSFGLQDQAPAEGNYFSQNVLSGNATDYSITSWAATSFFNSLGAPAGGLTPTPTPTPTGTPATSTPTPRPTATPTPGGGGFSGYYRLMARHSGKAVVVQSASTANGGDVIQWTYGGTSTNDEWELVNLGTGYYRVVNRNSGKVLDVAQASTVNAANVHQWAWGGATNQQWQIVDLGNGYHRLTARHSGKVLNVAGASTADGADVDQWSWASVNQQQFQLIQVP